jgi:molybdate-binding protein
MRRRGKQAAAGSHVTQSGACSYVCLGTLVSVHASAVQLHVCSYKGLLVVREGEPDVAAAHMSGCASGCRVHGRA